MGIEISAFRLLFNGRLTDKVIGIVSKTVGAEMHEDRSLNLPLLVENVILLPRSLKKVKMNINEDSTTFEEGLKILVESFGFQVKFDPLEISNNKGEKATGDFAVMVITMLETTDPNQEDNFCC